MSKPTTVADVPGATDQIAFELAREMRRRWRGGERPTAEAILSLNPDCSGRPEAAVELIYEEFCLRQAAGEDGVEQDLLRRFPQWAGPLRVMLDCHRRLIESDRDRPRSPGAGERVGEFRLLEELYRGARGLVFLAAQGSLADRRVVLKITPLDGAEHLSLARLQHTNIVPLYSVTDDPGRNVRILCMPYFGRATLASLLESLASVPPASRTGRDVAATIDAASTARNIFASLTYIQAVCWIGACLADALQFAHERGVVHLDLKPSNVLLAADGQPMLLDFHLARAPLVRDAAVPENLGGTPHYMPPEQQAAMRALREGRPVDVAVDGRADVYALGAMLYELLGGRVPIGNESPPLERINPRVSPGLSDIVAKCVARAAENRYANARSLADDLRRHLTDRPLAGVPNRSWAERWAKWRSRRPAGLRTIGMVLLVLAAVAILAAATRSDLRERNGQAELALRDGERQLNAGHFGEAVQTFDRGLALARRVPFSSGLERRMRDRHAVAMRRHLADRLHQLADQARILYGSRSAPDESPRAVALECRAFWSRRGLLMNLLGEADNAAAGDDLRDIAIFAASLPAESEADRAAAQRLLDEVEATFGPSAVLEFERSAHRPGAVARDSSPAPEARTAWEHCALGRAFLSSGGTSAAARHLSAALALDPAGRWTNFYFGQCAYRTGRYEDAVAAFSVCIGSAPDVAASYYNRGLALGALGRDEQALRDFDRALQLDPHLADAALRRDRLRGGGVSE